MSENVCGGGVSRRHSRCFYIEYGILCVLIRGDLNETTLHTFMVKKNQKDIPIMPPDLALSLTLLNSQTTPVSRIFPWSQRFPSH